MGIIVDLVMTGIKKLADLIPLWMSASAEERVAIEAKARSLVGGLDEAFAAADAKDDANTAAAMKAIADAAPKVVTKASCAVCCCEPCTCAPVVPAPQPTVIADPAPVAEEKPADPNEPTGDPRFDSGC